MELRHTHTTRETRRPTLVFISVSPGATAAAPYSTPSVDRKRSRVPAAFAENSTTRGRRPSGHLTTTAPGASTCPTRTPETHTGGKEQGAAGLLPGLLGRRCAGWSACFFRFVRESGTDSEIEDELRASDMSLGLCVCVCTCTHLSKAPPLCRTVTSREKCNRRTAAPRFTDSTAHVFYSQTSHVKGILCHLYHVTS